MIIHPISPVFDKNSKVLILGSFPSVKSREQGFFYGHPQNRFWSVIARLTGEKLPSTIEEKKTLLLTHGIAVWDVLASCEINGSADSTIKNATPNDIRIILDDADVKAIFVNGLTAARFYDRYIKPQLGREAVCLPSTSPANAAWSVERLVAAWSIILEHSLPQTKKVKTQKQKNYTKREKADVH